MQPSGQATLFSDFRYATAGRAAAQRAAVAFTVTERALLHDLAGRIGGLGPVGFESGSVSYDGWRELGSDGAELVPRRGLVEALRAVKDEGEIEIIRRACAITTEAYGRLLAEGLVGRSEREVAWRLEVLFRELGADGSGGKDLYMPGGGSLQPATHESVDRGDHLIHMNGREVFKFATRILVSSAEHILAKCGVTVDDVDVYIPHQANMRIIEYAVQKLAIPQEKVVVNVDRYGNTSGGSIPLALADAQAAGRLRDGALVLMTGMGTGLTWGSTLIKWNGTGEGR